MRRSERRGFLPSIAWLASVAGNAVADAQTTVSQDAVTLAEIWRDHRPVVVLLLVSMVVGGVLLVALASAVQRLRGSHRAAEAQSSLLALERVRLAALLHSLPDIVFLKDTEGRYRLCNAACARFLELPEAAILGRSDAELFDAATAMREQARDRAAFEHDDAVSYEERLQRPDGSDAGLFRITKTPIRDAQGRLLGVLGLARDITEMREAQVQLGERVKEQRCLNRVLRISEDDDMPVDAMLRGIAEALPAGWLHVESAVACVEWEGRRFDSPNCPEQLPAGSLRAPIRIDGKAFGEVVVAYVEPHPPRHEGPFLAEERALVDTVAQRIGSVIARRRYKESGRQQQEIFGAIVSQASSAITLVDAETLRFVEFNDAAWRNLGYTREEFAALTLPEIQGEFDPSTVRTMVQDFLRSGDAHFETLRRARDGSLLNVDVSLKVIQRGGRKYLSLIWTDISERVRMQALVEAERARLRESEERLRRLFQESRQPLMLIEDGRFVDANVAALEKLGFAKLEEFVGLTPVDISPQCQPDGQRSDTKAMAVIARAIESGSERFEWEHLRVDGSPFIAEVLLTAIPFAGKTLLHVVWTDITERKRLEARSRQFEDIVRFSEDAIVSLGLDGTVTSWNPGAERMYGYSTAEMLGQPLDRLFLPADSSAERDAIAKLVEGHRIERFETTRVRRDGAPIIVSTAVSAIRDGNDVVVGVSAISRDVTERQRFEEELGKLSLTVEQSSDSIVITNLAAEIEYVNPRFTEITGYTRAEAIGQNPRVLKSGKTSAAAYAGMWETLLQGRTWHGEFINLRKNGEEFIESAHITPLRDPRGTITHYVAVKEDVTEQKRIARELDDYRQHLEELVSKRTGELQHAMQVAESANRSKSTFLANMSHEIRTPMNAIIGFAHLLQSELERPSQREKLDKIIGSGKHLLGIINDILDLSKIEADRLSLDDTPFLVPAAIDHVRSMMSDRISSKGLRYIEEVDPRLMDLPLAGDSMRLGQILINYIGNAVKFTDQGSIALRATLQAVDDQRATLRFEVQDTGIGISEDKQRRLFETFEQGEASTTRKYGGTGLGLAISRRLARLMDGEAGVVSAPGQGSTFWFTARFRRAAASAVAGQADARQAVLRAGARVLLVEDNEVNQDVARELLERFGLTVAIANHGAQALEMAGRESFDLILMDMQMPVMDGLEATRRIRQLPAGKDIPILAMTANAFEEDRRRCEEAGMNGFVTKPVDPDRLRVTLARWIPATSTEPAASVASAPVPPAPMPDAILPLIDVQNGLVYLAGDMDKYRRMLRKFVDSHAADGQRIAELLRAGDLAVAQRTAHTVKGVAAALGMARLRVAAEGIDRRIRGNDPAESLQGDVASLQGVIDETVAEARTVIGEQLAPQAEVIDLHRLRRSLDELDAALRDEDMRSYVLWRELAPLVEEAVGAPRVAALANAIETFDFPAARTTLGELRSAHPELAG